MRSPESRKKTTSAQARARGEWPSARGKAVAAAADRVGWGLGLGIQRGRGRRGGGRVIYEAEVGSGRVASRRVGMGRAAFVPE